MVADAWPAVTYEPLTWEHPTATGLFRHELAISRKYQAAVPARIAALTPTVSAATAAVAEEAVAAMARFDGALPVDLGGLTAIILRSESASSSQIEYLTASARAVAEAEVLGAGRGNAEVIAANVTAMHEALQVADRLDADTIADIQATLLRSTSPKLVGWRREPVWIGGHASTPVTADFVPPRHELVEDCIADLVAFMHRDDLPVLMQSAIAHAQFETIHPFADGNGRVGRALVHIVLRSKNIVRQSLVPLSAGLLRDRHGYINALTAYRSGDVEPIIVAFARAALVAVDLGQQLSNGVTTIRDRWAQQLQVRADAAAWNLLDHFVAHPVTDAKLAAAALGLSDKNAHRSLQSLVEAGIVKTSRHHQSRTILYRAPEILAALDAYAAALGRRIAD